MRADSRWSTREKIGLGLATVGIVAAYALSGHVWVDMVDEGYFLDLGQRVLDGALPYRDFATYYTPGTFYLFALVFKLFGTNLLVIRYLMAGLRGLCALLLYTLTRRVAPWPLAWMPFAVVAALDAWPIEPEPHPSWPSIVACLLTLELIVRHLASGRIRWLVLAGGTAAASFLFKQNVGAFTALSLAGYILLRPRAAGGRMLRWAQLGFAFGAAALVTWLMHENLDALSAGGLWLPVLVTLGVLLYRAICASPALNGALVLEALASAGAFGVVTLAWLVPLLLALGSAQTPLGLFVGEVNQASIALPLAAFTGGIQPLLLGAIWVPVLLWPRLGGSRRLLVIAALLSGVALLLPVWHGPREPLTRDPQLGPLVGWLGGWGIIAADVIVMGVPSHRVSGRPRRSRSCWRGSMPRQW